MSEDRIVAFSPLRVSFAGGGTDIWPFTERYGGAVINSTIERGVFLSYRRDNYPMEISSRDFLKTFVYGNHGENNVQNRIIELLDEYSIKKGRLFISDEVPPGSGLGSSSALITALIKIVHEIRDEEIEPLKLAEESYKREKEFFGITLGKQDPYAISLGGFKYMEFKGDGIKTHFFERDETRRSLDERMLLVYSGRTRESSAILEDQVSKSSTGDPDTISKLKEIKEIASYMREAVNENNFTKFCDLINSGWEIKKHLSSNVSSKQIEEIITEARRNGARAARLLGGGNQGFVLIVADPEYLTDIQIKMTKISSFVTRISTSELGTRIIKI
ncbi:D,D-heptose 7-phosphate kinase [mine drainage metagenome]|uniref:D,D-heptose 7-phosphate kinase n=1 Tax=mine drainage metagenome TaxID=410659 RepID=T1AV34_9ZZZZ